MDKFAGLIEQLARVVGVQVERLWPEVIRVYWLTTLGEMIVMPMMVTILYCVTISLVKRGVAIPNSHYDMWGAAKVLTIIPSLVGMAVASVLLIIWLVTLPGNLAALAHPEASYVMSRLPGR